MLKHTWYPVMFVFILIYFIWVSYWDDHQPNKMCSLSLKKTKHLRLSHSERERENEQQKKVLELSFSSKFLNNSHHFRNISSATDFKSFLSKQVYSKEKKMS